jgi:two-component system, NarL family, sensor histidine kinase UhpB
MVPKNEIRRSIMRSHPARAMYDQIEDALTSITMQLRSAIEADARRPPRVNGKTNGASGALQRADGWARQVSADLGSVLLDTLGLAATIEWHARQFQKCTGVLYELKVSHAAAFDLPEDYAAAIFDVYNEALSNVARHAGASRVAIALTITPHEVTMVVRDDGVGLGKASPAPKAGGLAAIRARSQAHKGSCEVAGTPSGGTSVTVSLPLP